MRALLALLAAATLAAMMLLAPTPAHGHDTLLSSDPADGAALDASPEQITLTYSADVLEVSPVVQVSENGQGEPVVLDPVIDGPTVTAEITDPLPAGTHTVQWRVVSSDGHPIEGSFTFTVEGEAGAADGGESGADEPTESVVESEEAQQAEDAQQADDTGTQDEQGTDTETDETAADDTSGGSAEDQGTSTMPLLLGVVGVAVLGVAIAAFFAMRRR